MTKTAFITGITGQDGSYLAELLLEKGYDVYGLVRRLSTPNTGYIRHITSDIHLIEGDLMDQSSLNEAIKACMPDEVYNLAAQSFVATSWTQPVLTGEINALRTIRVLEPIRYNRKDARFYQASSSEMFGKVQEVPQRETTPFYPRSPYSSLSYLKHYPIDKLKIDQSFVHDMTHDPGDAALIVAIIAIGHSLSIPVLAEGIETPEQLAFLTANNCDLGQGFHIGKPMPLEALLHWFSDTTRWKPGNAQTQPHMVL